MIKSYLKIAWRNLLKHKTFSIINILGLSIGIGVCLTIFVYVKNELTYDQYNAKADRIMRVTTDLHTPESDMQLATAPILLATALKQDFPEVESTVRFENEKQAVKYNNDVLSEESFYKTDPDVFSIFSFDFIEGSAKGALENPQSIVITRTIEKKYFGNQPALGKTMICNGKSLLVKAVIKDRPSNSDIKIDALLAADFSKTTLWMDDFDTYIFILFNQKPDLKKLKTKLADLSKKYVQPELDAGGGGDKYKAEFELEPLTAVHFSEGKLSDMPKGDRQFNYVFSVLAVFILLIALLNYINLSTAKSVERAKEVGIRKVSGASQAQLIHQFLFESFFLLTIACVLAIALVQTSLPFFNNLLHTSLSIKWGDSLIFMGIVFLVTVLLAGLYPAFILSSFNPIKVLKGVWKRGSKGLMLRKVVTITQFAIAAMLIMGTTVIYYQMKFIENKNLGYNKNQLLDIWLPTDSSHMGAVKAFQYDLKSRPEIKGLTVGSGMASTTMATTITNSGGKKREFMSQYHCIDPQFLSVFNIPLVEGRNLSDNFSTDKTEAFLVNEAFVKFMGWKSAINQPLEGFFHKGKIVGVVKNFYFKSLHDVIEPLVMVYNSSPINTTSIKINPRDLSMVKSVYKKYLPEIPMDYSFFDEMVNKQYEKDNITMSLFNIFAILAIFVSCLGLYGLVAFVAVQRTKEISIRKVLGASIGQLFSLMSTYFLKQVLLALVIAMPIAGFLMNKWLTSYAYHVQLEWWMLLFPVMLTLIIALAVISREIIKVAIKNPVISLKTE